MGKNKKKSRSGKGAATSKENALPSKHLKSRDDPEEEKVEEDIEPKVLEDLHIDEVKEIDNINRQSEDQDNASNLAMQGEYNKSNNPDTRNKGGDQAKGLGYAKSSVKGGSDGTFIQNEYSRQGKHNPVESSFPYVNISKEHTFNGPDKYNKHKGQTSRSGNENETRSIVSNNNEKPIGRDMHRTMYVNTKFASESNARSKYGSTKEQQATRQEPTQLASDSWDDKNFACPALEKKLAQKTAEHVEETPWGAPNENNDVNWGLPSSGQKSCDSGETTKVSQSGVTKPWHEQNEDNFPNPDEVPVLPDKRSDSKGASEGRSNRNREDRRYSDNQRGDGSDNQWRNQGNSGSQRGESRHSGGQRGESRYSGGQRGESRYSGGQRGESRYSGGQQGESRYSGGQQGESRYSGGQRGENWFSGGQRGERDRYRDSYQPRKSTDEELTNFWEWKKQKVNEKFSYEKVREEEKDLFLVDDSYALGHCVGADFSMGSGIAVAFRKKFHHVGELLNQGQFEGGLALLNVKGRYIYYMVTKKRSSGKPTYDSFWASVQKMRDHMKQNNVKKLAIPRIGCGLDMLSWDVVKPMVEFLYREMDVEILVCNLQQTEDPPTPQKYRSSKVVHELYHVSKIDQFTIIVYIASEDEEVTEDMKILDEKFNYLREFKFARKKCGEVVRYDKFKNYILYGCIVKKKSSDPVDFEAFEKCLMTINKNNQKDQYEYVGFSAQRETRGDELNLKLINLLRNVIRNVDVYYCWPKELEMYAPRDR